MGTGPVSFVLLPVSGYSDPTMIAVPPGRTVTSYWPCFAQFVQRAFGVPQVPPPSAETLTAIYGFGNCIHAAYTYGADGSAATAGSHPLPMAGDEMIRSPVHPAFAAAAADDP